MEVQLNKKEFYILNSLRLNEKTVYKQINFFKNLTRTEITQVLNSLSWKLKPDYIIEKFSDGSILLKTNKSKKHFYELLFQQFIALEEDNFKIAYMISYGTNDIYKIAEKNMITKYILNKRVIEISGKKAPQLNENERLNFFVTYLTRVCVFSERKEIIKEFFNVNNIELDFTKIDNEINNTILKLEKENGLKIFDSDYMVMYSYLLFEILNNDVLLNYESPIDDHFKVSIKKIFKDYKYRYNINIIYTILVQYWIHDENKDYVAQMLKKYNYNFFYPIYETEYKEKEDFYLKKGFLIHNLIKNNLLYDLNIIIYPSVIEKNQSYLNYEILILMDKLDLDNSDNLLKTEYFQLFFYYRCMSKIKSYNIYTRNLINKKYLYNYKEFKKIYHEKKRKSIHQRESIFYNIFITITKKKTIIEEYKSNRNSSDTKFYTNRIIAIDLNMDDINILKDIDNYLLNYNNKIVSESENREIIMIGSVREHYSANIIFKLIQNFPNIKYIKTIPFKTLKEEELDQKFLYLSATKLYYKYNNIQPVGKRDITNNSLYLYKEAE